MSMDGMSPALALLQKATGFWISRTICVVAKLDITDLLKEPCPPRSSPRRKGTER